MLWCTTVSLLNTNSLSMVSKSLFSVGIYVSPPDCDSELTLILAFEPFNFKSLPLVSAFGNPLRIIGLPLVIVITSSESSMSYDTQYPQLSQSSDFIQLL